MTGLARKAPHNRSVLERWIGERALDDGVPVPRLRNWVSYMILLGALARAKADDGTPLFLLKGGVAIELRLGLRARATRDIDATYRESAKIALERLRDALSQQYGEFIFDVGNPEAIGKTAALRMDIRLSYRTRAWSTVQLEMGPAEGSCADQVEILPGIPLDRLGIVGPKKIASLELRYQLAQKLHACTHHFEDGSYNDRFRDLIDIILLRRLVPTENLRSVREACEEVFTVRERSSWPPDLVVPATWHEGYQNLATDLEFEISSVEDAADEVRLFIGEIANAE